MDTIVENAVKGQRKAMEGLYEKYKQRVYYVAWKLLLNKNQAADVAGTVFGNIWSGLSASNIATEQEFADDVMVQVAKACQKTVMKKQAKAFRMPASKNFLSAPVLDADARIETEEDKVLSQMPKLQRFLLVLHTVGRLNSDRLIEIFHFDRNVLDMALGAEEANVEEIIKQSGDIRIGSYRRLTDALEENVSSFVAPDKADARVLDKIDAIAKPIEQKQKKKMTQIGILAAGGCLVIVAAVWIALFLRKPDAAQNDGSLADGLASTETQTVETAEDLDASLTYYADIDIQDYGKITIALDAKSAPITTENFVSLAESGFYDGLTFHRIMEGFMMQGGDPDGNGTGGSDQTIVGEFSENGYENNLSHTRGAVSMARSADYDSASSQFFIVHEDSTFLDGQYAVFGYVTEGIEVVDAVCEAAEPVDSNGTITTENQPVITSVAIRTE